LSTARIVWRTHVLPYSARAEPARGHGPTNFSVAELTASRKISSGRRSALGLTSLAPRNQERNQGITKKARKLVFRKDCTYSALDNDDKELWAGTFDLDPTATPRNWDHRSNESKKKGGDALGIYELDGDKLKVVCVVGTWRDNQWTGKPRPTEFKRSSADVVLELRRVKPER
jgi:uncharacterized protein (TIGR03067 family)